MAELMKCLTKVSSDKNLRIVELQCFEVTMMIYRGPASLDLTQLLQ